MKLLLSVLLCISIITFGKSDESKYHSAMKKNLEKLGAAKTVSDYLEMANNFERIAQAEKDKWLPYYYTSFSYVVAGMKDSVKEKKDSYLEKANKFISIADSLQPDESEIYTLKGMIAQGIMAVDPMNRYMKYGQLSESNFTRASQIDSLNPRPDYLVGVSLLYTPEQFGGGPKTAKPRLEKSMEKFEKFVPKDDLMPNWGKEAVKQILSGIN